MGFILSIIHAAQAADPAVLALFLALGVMIREVTARCLSLLTTKVDGDVTNQDVALAANRISSGDNSFKSVDNTDDIHPTGPSKEEEEADLISLDFVRYPKNEMVQRAASFYHLVNKRRSVRHFSDEPIPDNVIDDIIQAAGTAPSGAHTQPWHFVVIQNPEYKKQLRTIIEEEEETNYRRRMGDEWVQDLAPMKTDWRKPYIEIEINSSYPNNDATAPAIIVVLRSPYSFDEGGSKKIHYYHELSTGIACGLLVTAIHNAGLATVTSTPLNAGNRIKALLKRPAHEKVVLLLPVGYPIVDCKVPNLKRKKLASIMTSV
eukprot:gene5829-7294_t